MKKDQTARIVALDGTEKEVALCYREEHYVLAEEPDYSQVKYIDFFPHAFDARVGSEGYYVAPKDIIHDSAFTGKITFRPRKEQEVTSPDVHSLPIMGAFLPEGATAVVLRGCQFMARFVYGRKAGVYYCFPRFTFEGEAPYEPLSVLVHELPAGADYSDLANFYREIRIADGCVPLKERIKGRPELKYAVEAPYVRIRLGWKPMPCYVEEQTPENEPPLEIAVTFRQVGVLVDALKAAGVEKAELCLVGWNAKGHDGRFPQLFPVEEELGGEAELRRAIKKAQENGYQITAHSTSTDTYRISEDWNEEDVVRRRDGSLGVEPFVWSAGRAYELCFQKAVEFAHRDFPRVADLGFRGIYYIDVLSIIPPRPCYHPAHPLNLGEAAACSRHLAQYTTQQLGGFCSEGGYDYLCADLDYALCPVRGRKALTEEDIFDSYVPLWHMVYHGIVLYNVESPTLNFPLSSTKTSYLKIMEHGARPTLYFNCNEGGDWWEHVDFRCSTPRQAEKYSKIVAEVQKEYSDLYPLQYEFMVHHEALPENKVRVTYSDGSVMTVDYQNETWSLEKGKAFAEK